VARVEGRVTALERDDIQGNVVRGYGYPFARYLFARVREDAGAAEAARRWLAAQADPVTSDADWGTRPRLVGNLALSFAGLTALRLPGWLLRSFPQDFRDGMAARAARIGDAGAAAPDSWDEGLRAGDIHVLVTLSGREERALASAAARVRGEMARNGFAPGLEREAAVLGDSREHFGFTDGFGQPAIAGVVRHGVAGQGVPVRRRPWHRFRSDIVPSAADRRLAWRALRPGEFVLGYEDEDLGRPPAPAPPLHRNGTFMVWRKLRQDVAGFRAWLDEVAEETGLPADLVAAKVFGRWPDGSPLVLRPAHGDPGLGNDRERVNDFGYARDPEGLACPRGAHVRRANPRDALRAGGRLTARHRILRRGMPYGTPLAPGAPDDGADRGLVFVALQASIERQFEIVQARWLNDGDPFGLGRAPDPVVGAVDGHGTRVTFGGSPPCYARSMRSFVTARGGEYLFVPGISGLRALATL
jgi:Dyp-type peroxidase family